MSFFINLTILPRSISAMIIWLITKIWEEVRIKRDLRHPANHDPRRKRDVFQMLGWKR